MALDNSWVCMHSRVSKFYVGLYLYNFFRIAMCNMWYHYEIIQFPKRLNIRTLKENFEHLLMQDLYYSFIVPIFWIRLHKADFIASIVAQVSDVDHWPLVIKKVESQCLWHFCLTDFHWVNWLKFRAKCNKLFII